MGRSSRIVCSVSIFIVAAAPVCAQGRRVMVHVPTNAATLQVAPHRLDLPRVPQRGVAALPRRFGRIARGGFGFGYYGAGLGLSVASDLATPPILEGGYRPEPQVIPGIAPPPCVRPQIIKIGLGPRHQPPTRVIYGPPNGCVF